MTTRFEFDIFSNLLDIGKQLIEEYKTRLKNGENAESLELLHGIVTNHAQTLDTYDDHVMTLLLLKNPIYKKEVDLMFEIRKYCELVATMQDLWID